MSFGITSAPEIFQRRLQTLLEPIKGTVTFMDDIMVHGTTMAGHDHALEATQQALKSAGLTLNPGKCRCRQTTVKYLGYVISGVGVDADPAKVEAVTNLPEPDTVAELRRTLGMFTYISRFLPDFSTIAAPLRSLLLAKSPVTSSMRCP